MTAALDLVAHALDTSVAGRAAAVHFHGARGAGKSWLLEQAASMALEREMTVLSARGMREDRELPFVALAALLGPVRERLVEPAWAALAAVARYDHRGADPFEVKLTTFQFLCSLAAERATVLVLDDLHLMDAASLDALSFTVRRADADRLCCVSADVDSTPIGSGPSVRIDPLQFDEIVELVHRRGVHARIAEQCADAAQGNPGLALAVADGLSDPQRAGVVPVAALPRPAGGLADELQRRLREHGEAVCRALVVAAAEHGGEVAAVRSALALLGEGEEGLAEAEAAGLVEIVGTRVLFADPWTRAASYHLVAPASRRAAHRALAAWFEQPNQAAERAWHLAAGADGPNDAVSDALALLAGDTARRGALASAALTAERAAEFAEGAVRRERHLLSALGWWLDAGGVDGVSRVVQQLDPTTADAQVALVEARAFLGEDLSSPVDVTDGPWGHRRTHRLAVREALDAGDHRAVLRLVDPRAIEHGRGDDLLAIAVAHRHAGRVREAREHVARAQAVTDPRSAIGVELLLVEADLDLLQGRVADAERTLASVEARMPAQWMQRHRWLAGRAALMARPSEGPSSWPDAFAAPGAGALAAVRSRISDAVARSDAVELGEAAVEADRFDLPIEAGEARLWLATISGSDERRTALTRAQGVFHRCGVRGWDARVAALGATDDAPAARPRDAAIDALSQAELRVADAVARGLTNREVASTLLISVKTVDFHLQQIYRKIGVRSRTELAVRMAGHGTAAAGEAR